MDANDFPHFPSRVRDHGVLDLAGNDEVLDHAGASWRGL